MRLQPQPGKVLCLLVEKAGNLVTREEIQKNLWQDETFVDFDQGLNYCIRQIRVALEDSADQPVYVETVPRRGYRFKAEVTPSVQESHRLYEPAPLAPVGDAIGAHVGGENDNFFPEPRPLSARLFNHAAVGVAAIALLGVVIYFGFLRRPRVEASGGGEHALLASAIHARPSVAVLGFANLDGKQEDAWLATALSEMFSTELSAGGKLRLVSGEEVTHAHPGPLFADSLSRESLLRLRHELGADIIVAGSYAVMNDGKDRKLRLDLRLQDTERGETLLAVAETGNAGHLFDLVTDTGHKLREKLGVAAAGNDELAVQQSMPENAVAQRLYAQGLQKLRVLDALTARDLLTEAAQAQPDFAPVHSALAEAWAVLGYDAKAADEAKHALDLANGLPREEHLSIEARYYDLTRDWQKEGEALHALVSFFPDNLDYGLRLARLESSAAQQPKALATLAALRHLPGPQGESPRIDLAEGHIRGNTGDFKQENELADRGIKKARDLDLRLLIAEGLRVKAHALERLGDMAASIRTSEEARQMSFEANDHRGVAVAMLLHGDVLYDKGDFAGSRQQFEDALSISQEIGNARGARDACERIGNSYYDQGKLAEARQFYNQALQKDRETEWLGGIASDTGNLANVLEGLGDLKGALKMNEEALRAFEETGQKRGAASTICNIGMLQWEMGNLTGATSSFQQAATLHQASGYQRGQGFAISGLGDVFVSRNNLDQARQRYEQARTLFQQTDQQDMIAQTNVSLAVVAFHQQRFSEAEKLVRTSLTEFEKDKDAAGIARGSAWLARILLAEGKAPEAVGIAQHAETYSSQITTHISQFDANLALARADAATGNLPEAIKLLRSVLDSAEREGYQQYSLEARLALIELDHGNGRARQLAAVDSEASQKGFGLISAQARSLAGQKSPATPHHP